MEQREKEIREIIEEDPDCFPSAVDYLLELLDAERKKTERGDTWNALVKAQDKITSLESQLASQREQIEAHKNKETWLPIIRGWKFHWMMYEPGYQERAHAIDSNMTHDLARRLAESKRLALSESEVKACEHYWNALKSAPKDEFCEHCGIERKVK
jgi:hypothetical protein